MELDTKKMNYKEAKEISNWHYKEPYSIYSMENSEEDINELLNGYYYSVSDINNNLIGYYCFGEAAKVPAGNKFGAYNLKDHTDIGLGIKPDLCGKGFGFEFLCSGLDFARNNLSAKDFRLTVAAFNKRAIKVYERAGFKKITSFERISESGKTEFLVMIL